ncbi:MAG: DUF1839 family protein [Gemmatimonadaceae bacterium]
MTAPMMSAVPSIQPAVYMPHELHRAERIWPETNCYVDLWIELLHSLRMDPCAMLAFTLAMDFEGDQWTFFKPSLSDIHSLYGVDVQELTIWRSLPAQIEEQVSLDRPVLVEVDAFFLPDTQGVSYGIHHTKTTIAVRSIDRAAATLGYFHNAGYFELSGADFDGLFAATSQTSTSHTATLHTASGGVSLAPYTEIAKLERLVYRSDSELCALARDLATQHLRRRPSSNPVTRYRERFVRDVTWLSAQDMTVFHQYAFATLRQCGACAELAASFLRWLDARCGDCTPAIDHFDTIAATAKALQFKAARAVSTRKPTEFGTMLDMMEGAWESAMADLIPRYGG